MMIGVDHKVIVMVQMIPLSEKVLLVHVSPCSPLGNPRDITFAVNIYLAYFIWEELELPPPAKPLDMVFVLERGVLSAIFRRKMEGMKIKEVWLRLVLPMPHGGSTVLVKK